MRFLISALGSAGDVHPFIAIAHTLAARGHAVRLLASAHFEPRVRRAGIDFIPLGSAAEFQRLVQQPDLWHPRRGPRLLIDELLRHLDEAWRTTAAAAAADGEPVLVGSTLSWNIRLLQDQRGLPGATVHLSPLCLPSALLPPLLPGLPALSRGPAWLVRALQWAGERWLLDRRALPGLNRLRAELGLAPARRLWSGWPHSPDQVLAAWPDWFAPPQRDWPQQAETTGFAFFDGDDGAPDPALEAFLQAGAPPVGITPGSAMAHGGAFFAGAMAACRALGRRALLITPYAAHLPAALPADAHHVGYAPFARLLPRLAALVHHGGVGTSAQALAAALPQLVVPFAHDQFDNAARLHRLGVSRTLAATAAPAAWTAALRALLGDPAVAVAVRRPAERIAMAGPGAAHIADRLEALGAGGRGRVAPAGAGG